MCALLVLAVGCGKKGPPLPPLTRIPSPPSEVSVLRRGGAVTVQLRVPTTNIDRASPGNIAQVDVYAFDGPPATAADVVIRNGQRVGRVIVNKPIDSDASPDEVDRIRAAQPKEAVDQGAVARIVDTLTTVTPTDAGRVRSYVAVAVNDRGRRGPASPVSVAPLGEAIAAPPAPVVTYSESAVTIAWSGENADENAGADAGANRSDATYFVSR
ncbi:MAG: hypothetical protein LBQ09_00215, partial [Acidobacteriaceae bacterium]|nr:hypothetical protein [Acidobacteriaceae bacterium]